LIPWLYLKGVSTGDFSEALQALLGQDAPGLSAATITRLKAVWEQEHAEWRRRSLKGKRYVYVWADGVHFNIRLESGERQCILVLMGATEGGQKELIAITDGYRESEQSWKELLLDVKARGLEIDPQLAIGDGALGFWKAVRQVYPSTRQQRCTVHKTANVLDKLPKSVQPKAKAMLHAIWQAETKEIGRAHV
jgi:putative transposase